MLKIAKVKIGGSEYDVISLSVGGWNLNTRRMEIRAGFAQEEADRVRIGKERESGAPATPPLFANITIEEEQTPDPELDRLFQDFAQFLEEKVEPFLLARGRFDALVYELGEEEFPLAATHSISGKPYRTEPWDEQLGRQWKRSLSLDALKAQEEWQQQTQ